MYSSHPSNYQAVKKNIRDLLYLNPLAVHQYNGNGNIPVRIYVSRLYGNGFITIPNPLNKGFCEITHNSYGVGERFTCVIKNVDQSLLSNSVNFLDKNPQNTTADDWVNITTSQKQFAEIMKSGRHVPSEFNNHMNRQVTQQVNPQQQQQLMNRQITQQVNPQQQQLMNRQITQQVNPQQQQQLMNRQITQQVNPQQQQQLMNRRVAQQVNHQQQQMMIRQ
jgi:hypothetical protein